MQVNSDRTVRIGDTTYSLESFLQEIGQTLLNLGTTQTAPPPESIEVKAIKDRAGITTKWRVESLTYSQLLELKAAFRNLYPSRLWFLVDFIPDPP